MAVSVVGCVVNVSLVLECRIVPAVVNSECNKIDFLAAQCTRSDGRVLRLKIRRKFGSVMTYVESLSGCFTENNL